MDPQMLTEILSLAPYDEPNNPNLRPGYIVGSSCKLWGQYPALVDGPPENIVKGMVCDVQTVEDGEKLAAYETRNYAVKPCFVTYTDGKEPATAFGHTFAFAGDPRELDEGEFDLKIWLRRMGRAEAVDGVEAAK
ncbi:hypothetical protein EMCG_07161 [[Emmonsia] crescens]|uniref:Gamma-glutamylcyclotransferase AIG2-like domain-containing protein n=1 Tax=[Emmonsia] crescens TaxID=73230 RepID=A0A0G2J5Y0_9EURO|nr:hypothetical protein EMCG_07161 [Emmonsia crescens UAMH 3008]